MENEYEYELEPIEQEFDGYKAGETIETITIQNLSPKGITNAKKYLKHKMKSNKREDIIDWLVKVGCVDDYSRLFTIQYKLQDDDAQDCKQESWIEILDVPQDKWNDLYRQGEELIILVYVRMLIKYTFIDYYRNSYFQHNERMDDKFWLKAEETIYDE